MTVAQTTSPSPASLTIDLYRDVHKGIRAELFALTAEAGRVDPHDAAARVAVAAHVHALVGILDAHAGHEDAAIQPVLEKELPNLAVRVQADHHLLEDRSAELRTVADGLLHTPGRSQAAAVHQLYLQLAGFTSAYLGHQDFEERTVQPALAEAIGAQAVMDIHGAIVSSIPPDQMAAALAIMLPAMNVDGRAELLGGMQANAPQQVFEGIWGLSAAVLAPADQTAVAMRLGIN
jgi:Hemerythrin HHE cation binding domain